MGKGPTFELISREIIMNPLKLLARFQMHSAGMRQNRALSTRMPAQNTSSIVYITIDNNPAVILSVVFLDFLPCELLLRGGGFPPDLFDLLLGGLLHPSIGTIASFDRMAKEQIRLLILRFLVDFELNLVPGVVHHSAVVSLDSIKQNGRSQQLTLECSTQA